MFEKSKCKICGDEVRFVIRHLKQNHENLLDDYDIINLRMDKIMKKYFD